MRRIFAGRRECCLAELVASFPSEFQALPKLCAMMVGRVVALDISSKLEPSSVVKLV